LIYNTLQDLLVLCW